MLAGALLALFFAWNGSQTFEGLEAKRSVKIHCVKAKHSFIWRNTHLYINDTPTYISITGACAFIIVPFVFSVMAGLIVDMLFMLSSIYNTV